MKILVGNKHLKSVGGSETFTYALIKELKRQCHDVEFFTLQPGDVSDRITSELNVHSASRLNYDLILTGQSNTVTAIKDLRLTGPVVQICHGKITVGEQPNERADGFISISEEVQKHLEVKGFKSTVVLNGIDCDRYQPTRKISDKLEVIASLVQTEEAYEMIKEAAKTLGIKVIRLNKYKDKIWEVEKFINKSDLVVSLGRGCFEAMACGRPVVIFDKRRYQESLADGYLAPTKFVRFIKNNCSGRASELQFAVDDLVREFRKYNPDHGAELRRIAIEELNIEIQTNKILQACKPIMDAYPYPGSTDVVYVLGTGSTWANNEIRFSIRSFVKHFKDLRNIVIVGEKPDFLNGIIHIPCPDKMDVNKDARMAIKIMAACRDERVSDNFIFCTDDTVLLCDLTAEDLCGWHDGPIRYDSEIDLQEHMRIAPNSEIKKPSAWFDFVYNTGRELQKRNLPDNNYDRAHSPQPINKAEFLEIIEQWDISRTRYTISNIYNNSTKLFHGKQTGLNAKIYSFIPTAQIEQLTDGKQCLNFNDNSLSGALKDWLYKTFAKPTNYESFATESNKRESVEKWFEAGCNYEDGLSIFKYYAPKNKNLIRFFEIKRNSELSDKKLKKTLQLWLR